MNRYIFVRVLLVYRAKDYNDRAAERMNAGLAWLGCFRNGCRITTDNVDAGNYHIIMINKSQVRLYLN